MINKSPSYNDELAAGIIYSVVPLLNAYAESLYGKTHQGGVSQITGTAPRTTIGIGSRSSSAPGIQW